MHAGKVIRWINFRERQYGGKIKPRWFVCLGNTRVSGAYPEKIYYFHSITRTRRVGIRHISFNLSKYPFLTESSYLYFNEGKYSYTEQDIANKDISIKGEMDKLDLKIIYDGILHEPRKSYTDMELFDIHDSLNSIGLHGLKKPSPIR